MKKRADGRYLSNIVITCVDGTKKTKSFYGKSPAEVRRKILEFTGERSHGRTLQEVCADRQAESEDAIR